MADHNPLSIRITNLVASVLGTSMLTLQIVKFSILASLFLSVYGAMRLLGFSRSSRQPVCLVCFSSRKSAGNHNVP